MAYFRSNAVHVSPGIIGGTCKDWSQVCHMGEKHVFPSGHLLTFEGDHFDDFLYLQSGKVTGIYLGADGFSNVALFYESGVLLRGCPACFLILKGVVISSHETNRFS